jgi:hypothetical protein
MAVLRSDFSGLTFQDTTPTGGDVQVTVNNNDVGGCGCGCSSGNTTTPTDPGNPGSAGATNPSGGKGDKGTTPDPGDTTKKPLGGCIPLSPPYFTGYGQDGMEFLANDGLATAIITAAISSNLLDPTTESIATATINVKAYAYNSLNASIGIGPLALPINKEMRNLLIDDGSSGVPTFGEDKWKRTRGYPIYFEDKSGPFKAINVAIPADPPIEVTFDSGNFRTYDDTLTLDLTTDKPITLDGQLGAPRKLPGGVFGPHKPAIAGDAAWIKITLCKITTRKIGETGGNTGDGTPGRIEKPKPPAPPPPGPGDTTIPTNCLEMYNLPYGSGDTTITDLDLSALARFAALAAGKMKSGDKLKAIKFDLKAVSFQGSNIVAGTPPIPIHWDEYVRLTGSDGVVTPLPGNAMCLVNPGTTTANTFLEHVWNEKCSMEVKTTPPIKLNAKFYGYDHGLLPKVGAMTMENPAWCKICLQEVVITPSTCPEVTLWYSNKDEPDCWSNPSGDRRHWIREPVKAGTLATSSGAYLRVLFDPDKRGDFSASIRRLDTNAVILSWSFGDIGGPHFLGGYGAQYYPGAPTSKDISLGAGLTPDTLLQIEANYTPGEAAPYVSGCVVSGFWCKDTDEADYTKWD